MDSRFWKWVVSRHAGDNPRGDFIRDTRYLIKWDIDPNIRICGADRCTRDEYDKLKVEFVKHILSSRIIVTSIRKGLCDGYIVELEPQEDDE